LKSSWVTILQGVEFSIFPLILAWALQQCSATALPVMTRIREEEEVEKLTEFLNELDDSHNIKFTYKVEQGSQLPFLDLLLNRTENGGLKLRIYRKPTTLISI